MADRTKKRNVAVGFALLLLAGCSVAEDVTKLPQGEELAYRRSLGIPDEAKTVVVYSQSSHLDINWQRTFEEYQTQIVNFVVNEALDLLDGDPQAVYSMAEMGFLRGWWDTFPESHERLRKYVANGRFKIVGGGVTTPDTNLPPSESVIRDYVEGIRWARENFGAVVADAWIPDSFGHNPLTPDLLWGLGFTAVGFSRVDGGPGVPFKLPAGLQKRMMAYEFTADSHAAELRDRVGQSFRWTGGGRASVQGMYMPYTYCQGETLGAISPLTLPGVPINLKDDAEQAVVEMTRYHEQLAPFNKTGYLFVPVGCDFQPPKELLSRFVADWNRLRYSETGVWALRATFEEFRKLVAFHDAELPRLALDGNPVWTGYYGERPRIKQLSYEGVAWLTGHELLAAITDTPAPKELAAWWWIQALSNHHDWIPGTSPDRVYLNDQLEISKKMVADAKTQLAARLGAIAAAVDHPGPLIVALNPAGAPQDLSFDIAAPGLAPNQAWTGRLPDDAVIPVTTVSTAGATRFVFHTELPPLGYTTLRLEPGAAPTPPVRIELRDAADAVTTQIGAAAKAILIRDDLRVVLERAQDWSLTSLRNAANFEWLSGPSDQLVIYHDGGGLYQIGSERGCRYEPLTGVPAGFTLQAAVVRAGIARVVLTGNLLGLPVTREVELAATGPLAFAATLRAPAWTTVVARFETTLVNAEHRNGVGYGSVTRPFTHLYAPAYWPTSWSGLFGVEQGVIVARGESTGFAASADGRIEMMLNRNAFEERCAELGAGGHDESYSRLRYALQPFDVADRSAEMAAAYARTLNPLAVVGSGKAGGIAPLAVSPVRSLTPGVVPASLRRTDDGVIVRVVRFDDGIKQAEFESELPENRVEAVDLRDRPTGDDVKAWPTVDMDERIRSFRLH